ncbi:DUF6817 domain-containing protein [Kribbella deserti]|uniref:DUF6817 domain-containing protein n=1 Tax=Kribbella deserti TaxID=1926257 RepID=A0ABV6QEH2_9ACTN
MTTVEDLDGLLLVRGADDLEHAGGTLFVHLHRVARRLSGLGASQDLVLAALAHAAYGTDGFPSSLFDWQTERGVLSSVIGAEAEQLVYRYGCCAREASWPGLAEHRTVQDRFTGASYELTDDELRDFADLSIVNELDVLDHAPDLEPQLHGYLADLVPRWTHILSPAVRDHAQERLGIRAGLTPEPS